MFNKKFAIEAAKYLLPVILILFIYHEGKNELRRIDPSSLLIDIKSLSPAQLLSIFLIGLIAVSALTAYDAILAKKLNLEISLPALAKISWISNSINNVVGFGGVAGASLRAFLLKGYTKNSKSLLGGIIWLTPFMLTGLSVMSLISIISFHGKGAVLEAYPWLNAGFWGMAAFLPIYLIFLYVRRNNNTAWEGKWAGMAVLASVLEWFSAAAFLWGIAVVLGFSLPFNLVLAIFVAGAVAGSLSLVPGGAGAFDIIVMIGLQQAGLEDGSVLLVLVFYRIFYYIVPFIIGLILASTEVAVQTKELFMESRAGRFIKKYNLISNYLVANLSYWSLSVLVFISGVLLLISAGAPAGLEQMLFAEKLFSESLLNLSFQLSVTAGISLLLLSRSIYLKVRASYILTYMVLVSGAVFTFFKGIDLGEALFLLGMAALLRGSKKQFSRDSSPFSWKAFFITWCLTLGTVASYIMIGFFDHPYGGMVIPAPVRDLLVKKPSELFVSAVIGTCLAVAFNKMGFRFMAEKETHPYMSKTFSKRQRNSAS
ncbi:lysylphosphatidylglycerol synthase domain-containing protein [Bacillus infantis]|uniref:lysylphosphatidylglycerol synthase domain-containing protein n=1 Tax=Bacillus infantis TaxID=324767 RepID=UPI003015A46A